MASRMRCEPDSAPIQTSPHPARRSASTVSRVIRSQRDCILNGIARLALDHAASKVAGPFRREAENIVGEPEMIGLEQVFDAIPSPRPRGRPNGSGRCRPRSAWRTSCSGTDSRGWRPGSSKNSRALISTPGGTARCRPDPRPAKEVSSRSAIGARCGVPTWPRPTPEGDSAQRRAPALREITTMLQSRPWQTSARTRRVIGGIGAVDDRRESRARRRPRPSTRQLAIRSRHILVRKLKLSSHTASMSGRCWSSASNPISGDRRWHRRARPRCPRVAGTPPPSGSAAADTAASSAPACGRSRDDWSGCSRTVTTALNVAVQSGLPVTGSSNGSPARLPESSVTRSTLGLGRRHPSLFGRFLRCPLALEPTGNAIEIDDPGASAPAR